MYCGGFELKANNFHLTFIMKHTHKDNEILLLLIQITHQQNGRTDWWSIAFTIAVADVLSFMRGEIIHQTVFQTVTSHYILLFLFYINYLFYSPSSNPESVSSKR